MREAASARAMLAMAAAERWDAEWEECEVEGGLVRYGENSASFGELVLEAADFDPPDPAPLRVEPAAEAPAEIDTDTLLAFPRLDLPAKVDGSFLFAGDIRLPGLVYASIRHAPTGSQELSRFAEDAVAGMRGLVGVVRSKRYLAAVGESWWIAEQALKRLAPVFSGPPPVESAEAEVLLDEAIGTVEPEAIASIGDANGLLAKPDLEARYSIAPAVHAGIETATATARLEDGKLELWIASQTLNSPGALRRGGEPAGAVSTPRRRGQLRCAAKRHAIEVVQIANWCPVQLMWPRVQVSGRPPRTPVVAGTRRRSGRRPASGSPPGARSSPCPRPCAKRAIACSTISSPKLPCARRRAGPTRSPAVALSPPTASPM